ncbi:hypothetical protein ABZ949_10585 [Micromonospora tulbaghiae]|uniref:hypothetical protein n=1 Tax=Micromonospora tulbaghiae TaxID=479978 RepID=UPI001FD36C4C|nr:hypothetical protein [Micromonospora tulbaghiae]
MVLAAEAGADIVLLIGPVSIASVSAVADASRRLGIPVMINLPEGRLGLPTASVRYEEFNFR